MNGPKWTDWQISFLLKEINKRKIDKNMCQDKHNAEWEKFEKNEKTL